jgi:hypothetical protein
MGPKVAQRAQPYATFKQLLNGLLYGPAVAATRRLNSMAVQPERRTTTPSGIRSAAIAKLA